MNLLTMDNRLFSALFFTKRGTMEFKEKKGVHYVQIALTAAIGLKKHLVAKNKA